MRSPLHRCITGITRASACPSSFFGVLPHTLYITSATRTTCSMRITCATCASLSCVHYGYSGRPRRGSSDMQDRRLAQTWGLLRRNWSIPVAFSGGGLGWFCLRFPHVCRRGWIHEAFQRVRSNRCVIPAAHQVRRTHRDATHITHHSVRSPPAGGGIFFRSPRLNVVRVPRGLGVFHQVRILRVLRALW